MSHLARVIAYREHLTSINVICAVQQSDFCQEAYIRALIANHCRFHDSFDIGEEEEGIIWNQLDKWNSVSPLKARLILESVKHRLRKFRHHLISNGTAPGNGEFAVSATVKVESEGVVIDRNIDVTDNEPFRNLVNYLCEELRNGHE